tara:strand:+ start:2747 stop:3358 length:612 start_codon:yes stop_codon:yes gene_type:complete
MDLLNWFNIGVASVAVITGVIYAIKQKCKKHKRKKSNNFWKIHTDIHEVLTELRVKANCARTQIVQFHNGEYFMDGVSMRKFSLTHESINKGISSEADKIQNLIISRFVPLLNVLFEDDPKIILTEEVNGNCWKGFLESGNVVAVAALPLKHKGFITGYVICQWCSWEKAIAAEEDLVGSKLIDSRNLIQINLSYQLRGKENL